VASFRRWNKFTPCLNIRNRRRCDFRCFDWGPTKSVAIGEFYWIALPPKAVFLVTLPRGKLSTKMNERNRTPPPLRRVLPWFLQRIFNFVSWVWDLRNNAYRGDAKAIFTAHFFYKKAAFFRRAKRNKVRSNYWSIPTKCSFEKRILSLRNDLKLQRNDGSNEHVHIQDAVAIVKFTTAFHKARCNACVTQRNLLAFSKRDTTRNTTIM